MKSRLSLVFVVLLLASAIKFNTFAWFTSEASSTENTIQSGILEIGNHGEFPEPLLTTEGDWEFADGGQKWYPGAELAGRVWTIQNKGNLPSKIYGVSAELYDFKAPENHPYDLDASKEELEKDLKIKITRTLKNVEVILFEGTLYQLKSLQLFQNDSFITLTNEINKDKILLYFNVKLDESASNRIQGVSAKIKFTVYATQTNAPVQDVIKQ